MSFFKKNRVIWRDRAGQISCPGDSCLKECDENCPIWLNTVGAEYIMKGQYDLATEKFRKGTEMAPDFPDLWNNLGHCLGNLKNYREAYNAFKKAYELGGKKTALHGLAVSARDCGKKEEALEYCKEYRRKFGDGALDRVELGLTGKTTTNTSAVSYMDIYLLLIKCASEDGYVDDNNSIPFIPELLVQAESVCRKIYTDLRKSIEEDVSLNYSESNKLELIAQWCIYTGMGAVWFWNNDWENIKEVGIVEYLSAPEGIGGLDDIVLDAIGIGRSPENSSSIRHNLSIYTLVALTKLVDNTDSKQVMEIYKEILKGMYMFGMTIEMERLGMH